MSAGFRSVTGRAHHFHISEREAAQATQRFQKVTGVSRWQRPTGGVRASIAPQPNADQGLCRRKNWMALVVLAETLKTASLMVTTLLIGCQRLAASRLRTLSTEKPV